MKKMIIRVFLLIAISCFSCVLLFFSCNTPKIYKVDALSLKNITLMPFESEKGDLGYIDSETFEIVIPAQYKYAGPFIGDFALVSKDKEAAVRRKANFFIINKNNKTVLKNINHAVFFNSIDGNTVFALTSNYTGSELNSWGNDSPLTTFFRIIAFDYRPKRTTYRLYNLTAGKLLIDEDTRGYNAGDTLYMPKIRLFLNYLLYYRDLDGKDLYEINSDGTFTKSKTNLDDLISKMAEERKIVYETNSSTDNAEVFFNLLYERNFDKIDFDLLSKIIPDDMDFWETGKRYNLLRNIHLIDRDGTYPPLEYQTIYPLKEKNLLYQVSLKKSKSYAGYKGLYDAENNKWAIPPVLKGEFHASGYDDWIISGELRDLSSNDFYDIKKRKVYKELFKRQRFTYIMTYYGYSKWVDKDKVLIEDY